MMAIGLAGAFVYSLRRPECLAKKQEIHHFKQLNLQHSALSTQLKVAQSSSLLCAWKRVVERWNGTRLNSSATIVLSSSIIDLTQAVAQKKKEINVYREEMVANCAGRMLGLWVGGAASAFAFFHWGLPLLERRSLVADLNQRCKDESTQSEMCRLLEKCQDPTEIDKMCKKELPRASLPVGVSWENSTASHREEYLKLLVVRVEEEGFPLPNENKQDSACYRTTWGSPSFIKQKDLAECPLLFHPDREFVDLFNIDFDRRPECLIFREQGFQAWLQPLVNATSPSVASERCRQLISNITSAGSFVGATGYQAQKIVSFVKHYCPLIKSA